MYKIRCKNCNCELQVETPNKGQSCKCPNRAYIRLDNQGLPVILAEDLTRVELITGFTKSKPKSTPITYDLSPKRKVRKLDYEVR